MRPDHAAVGPRCNLQGGRGKKHGAMRVKKNGERKNSECSECIDPPGARWEVLLTGAVRQTDMKKKSRHDLGRLGQEAWSERASVRGKRFGIKLAGRGRSTKNNSMIKWIRTSRLSMKNSLSWGWRGGFLGGACDVLRKSPMARLFCRLRNSAQPIEILDSDCVVWSV